MTCIDRHFSSLPRCLAPHFEVESDALCNPEQSLHGDIQSDHVPVFVQVRARVRGCPKNMPISAHICKDPMFIELCRSTLTTDYLSQYSTFDAIEVSKCYMRHFGRVVRDYRQKN